MTGIARQTDSAECDSDVHGCPLCPHKVKGIIVTGSKNVFINGLPASRKSDKGLHAACCNGNFFEIVEGSTTVFVNSEPVAKKGSKTKHCGGSGKIVSASENVLVN